MPSDTRKTFGSSDVEVTGRNNITFKDLIIRNQHSILKIDDRNFSFNLKEKPLESQKFVSRTGVSTITYSTTSSTVRGPIFKTKINFPEDTPSYLKLLVLQALKVEMEL